MGNGESYGPIRRAIPIERMERGWHFTIASLTLALGLALAVVPWHAVAYAAR